MNTVTSLKTTCNRENIVRLFARFANKYGTLWTNRLGVNPDWDSCIDDWHQDLIKYEYQTLVLAAKSALSTFTDFPPTFGQFEDLCKKHSGFLQIEEAVKMLLARDFSHPIVKIMYDRIGSWTLKNGKDTEIQAKAKNAYREAEIEFSLYPDRCFKELQAFNAKPKELPEPSKIPSATESKAFRECMNKCQEIPLGKKINAAGKTYKEFDEQKIKIGGRNFDKAVYNQWRDYLLSIPETETMILPPKYAHARMKLIASKEQPNLLLKSGYNPNPHVKEKVDSRGSNGPYMMYKSYTGE